MKKITEEQASLIAFAINTLSIDFLNVDFTNKFPEILNILAKSKRGFSDWDFFMTSAGIAFAIIYFGEENYDSLVREALKIDNDMLGAINNFFDFKERYKDKEICNTIGMWVLWNIAGECPKHSDCYRLAPVMGSFLKNIIDNFFDDEKSVNK